MSRDRLWRVLLFAIPLAVFFSQPVHMVDFAIWVAQGREILARHQIVGPDTFSILPTSEFVYPSWGVAVFYGLLNRWGGLPLVVLVGRLFLLPILYVAYRLSIFRLRSFEQSPWTERNLALVLVSWIGAIPLWADRPGFIALLPLVIGYGIASQERPLGIKGYAKLGILEAVWANLHGSFVLLPLLLFWRAVFAPKGRKLANVFGAVSVAAYALVNPFGYKVFPFVWQTIVASRARIEEWQLTGLSSLFPTGLLCLGLAVLLVIGIIKRRISWKSPFLLLVALGLFASRFAPLPFVLLLPFAYAEGLLTEAPGTAAPGGRWRTSLNAAIAGFWIIAAVVFTPQLKSKFAWALPRAKQPVFDETAPFSLAAAIRAQGAHGPVLSHWDFAGFLALEQESPIFIDERNVIYSDGEFDEVRSALAGGAGWRAFMARYGVRFLVLKTEENAALIREVEESRLFQRRFEENGAVLYSR